MSARVATVNHSLYFGAPIYALPYAAAFWVVLIIGNVLPLYREGSLPLGVNTVVALLFIAPLLCRVQGSLFNRYALLTLYCFLIGLLAVGMLRTDDAIYAAEKIDGAIIVPFLASFVAVECISKHGHLVCYQALCAVLLAVLLLTLVYKLHYGFFDRKVRYFLNGPIVFSWLMGVLALLSLHLGIHTERRFYYFIFGLAFLAVLWAMSKGPLLALSATLAFYFLKNSQNKKTLIALVTVSGVIAGALFLLKDILMASRYMAIFRVAQGQDMDHGSVGVRLGMWMESIDLAYAHPLWGVGLANWQFHTDYDLIYPHNVILELASEMGIVFTFLVLLTLVITAWKIRHEVFFPVTLFLFLGLLFSGDLTYLRYPLAFLITAYCVKDLWPERLSLDKNTAMGLV